MKNLGAEAESLNPMDQLAGAMYVGIVGSRIFPEEEGRRRIAALVALLGPDVTVVTGGAPGIDSWAEELATTRRLKCAVVRPSRAGDHTAADYMGRNTVIVRGSDIVVAFWDGGTEGTKDSIEKALLFHGRVIVALPGENPVTLVPF